PSPSSIRATPFRSGATQRGIPSPPLTSRRTGSTSPRGCLAGRSYSSPLPPVVRLKSPDLRLGCSSHSLPFSRCSTADLENTIFKKVPHYIHPLNTYPFRYISHSLGLRIRSSTGIRNFKYALAVFLCNGGSKKVQTPLRPGEARAGIHPPGNLYRRGAAPR
ncbi:MAG TPA: hypothetical protein VMV49_14560, partial [Candidatus Deferrimicrobium sp.]|nr:hypothetical protein [Candidatus Deferrimicrobium sp.]